MSEENVEFLKRSFGEVPENPGAQPRDCGDRIGN
jgi:hypothetical protein